MRGMSTTGSTEALEAIDVGLSPGDLPPFEFRAGARPSPLVVSFPHVGLEWPAGVGTRPQVSFPRNADYAVDRLYVRAEALGAATLRSRISRLVVDLNRADDDIDPALVPDHPAPRPRPSLSSLRVGRSRRVIRNRGVVWANAVGNIPLFTTLGHREFADRIRRFHAPYHRALEVLLARRRAEFGYAILLDAHSMPGSVGSDMVLGTLDGTACSKPIAALAVEALSGQAPSLKNHFERRGAARWPLTLSVDDPYRGGYIARHFGRPSEGTHALQLEVSRALYMDEYRFDLAPVPDPGSFDLERDQDRPSGATANGSGHRGEQKTRAAQRDRRRLAALVGAIDALVAGLSTLQPGAWTPSSSP